jgi:hypothetical protein
MVPTLVDFRVVTCFSRAGILTAVTPVVLALCRIANAKYVALAILVALRDRTNLLVPVLGILAVKRSHIALVQQRRNAREWAAIALVKMEFGRIQSPIARTIPYSPIARKACSRMFHGQRRSGDTGCRCTRGNGNAPGLLTLSTTDAVFLVCALPTHFARMTRSTTVNIRFVSIVLAVHAGYRGRRQCSRHERRVGRSRGWW